MRSFIEMKRKRRLRLLRKQKNYWRREGRHLIPILKMDMKKDMLKQTSLMHQFIPRKAKGWMLMMVPLLVVLITIIRLDHTLISIKELTKDIDPWLITRNIWGNMLQHITLTNTDISLPLPIIITTRTSFSISWMLTRLIITQSFIIKEVLN